MATYSASTSSFLFLTSAYLTFPKWIWFHPVNSLPHFLILWVTFTAGSAISSLKHQTASTISEQPRFEGHISSNLKGLAKERISKPSGVIHNGLWSEESECRLWTFEPKNFKNQSWLASPRSCLSQMECPSTKFFRQVNCEPAKLRLMNPHLSMKSLKSCFWAWLLLLPPFSPHLFRHGQLVKIPST